ncbi:MAG: outer membrane protein assembly factor BamA [Nitrospirae bacterium]|nr:outer membrane protein assembly factor BamA [Nitrospirota bacterium]
MNWEAWEETSNSVSGSSNIMKKILRYLMIFIVIAVGQLPAVVFAVDETSDIKTRPITSIEVSGLFSMSEPELLYLLNIEKGGVLDRETLSDGVKRAFLTGIFDDIVIENLDAAGTAIAVRAKEKPVISSITIKGNSYFSNSFVRKELSFSSAERLTGLKIREGTAKLIEAMRKGGFLNADALSELKPAGKNEVTVEVIINEGAPELIRQIVIPAHGDVINDFLPFGEGSIFDHVAMEHFKNKVLQYYRKKDFVGTSLSYAWVNGVLTLNLDPGKMLKVVFSGNSALKSDELMKEVPFFEINEINDDLIEETMAGILALYRKNGFILAQATPIISGTPDTSLLQIYISEGDRYKVGEVTIDGASISQDRLKDILVSKAGDDYNPDDLETDRSNLGDFYHALGYLDIEVQEPEVMMQDHKALIKYVLNEKQQVKIENIEIAGTKNVSADEIMKIVAVKSGSPYNDVDISESRRKIIELYNNRGFLEAKVSVKRDIAGAAARILFVVSEGNITFFGKNIILGNDRTRQFVIEREFIHETSMPFDTGKLLQERQRLYRLGLFSDVEVAPSDQSDGKRDVIYKLREADAGAVEFGLGYGEFEKYRAFLDVSYRNIFGMNRQASFRTEISSIEKRFILSYSEPFFFIRDLVLKSSLLYESKKELNIDTHKTSYHLSRETASVGVEKKLSDTVKGSLNYDFSVVKTKDVDPNIILSREDTGSLIISGVRPELIYDTRDNPFDPKKGVLAGLTFKVASAALFSQTDFLKLQVYANKYQSLSKRFVVAVSLRGGAAQGFGDTRELPIVERFFLGGRTTVRGYDQDTLGPKAADSTPIGGNAFIMGNLELRADVGRGFGVVAFSDAGNVWDKIQNIDIAQLKYTTGLGLRYNTPVGPLRVDYGVKLNREKGESFGAVHFSVGHAF